MHFFHAICTGFSGLQGNIVVLNNTEVVMLIVIVYISSELILFCRVVYIKYLGFSFFLMNLMLTL